MPSKSARAARQRVGHSTQSRYLFDKILREFNGHLQLYFLVLEELGGGPILHARDKAIGYSETTIFPSSNLEDSAAAFCHNLDRFSSTTENSFGGQRVCQITIQKSFSGTTGYPYRRGLLVFTTGLELLSQDIIVFTSSSNAC